MKSRIVFGALLLIGAVGTAIAAGAATTRHWSIVNFRDPVLVSDRFVMGPVLIVHDDEKMARGEACTTFYRFVPGKGPEEALVSFHCRPAEGEIVENTVLTVVSSAAGCKRLVDYQIAGDGEVRGVPQK
jgi:hypothetical protein